MNRRDRRALERAERAEHARGARAMAELRDAGVLLPDEDTGELLFVLPVDVLACEEPVALELEDLNG